jgi:hypothetical protein
MAVQSRGRAHQAPGRCGAGEGLCLAAGPHRPFGFQVIPPHSARRFIRGVRVYGPGDSAAADRPWLWGNSAGVRGKGLRSLPDVLSEDQGKTFRLRGQERPTIKEHRTPNACKSAVLGTAAQLRSTGIYPTHCLQRLPQILSRRVQVQDSYTLLRRCSCHPRPVNGVVRRRDLILLLENHMEDELLPFLWAAKLGRLDADPSRN